MIDVKSHELFFYECKFPEELSRLNSDNPYMACERLCSMLRKPSYLGICLISTETDGMLNGAPIVAESDIAKMRDGSLISRGATPIKRDPNRMRSSITSMDDGMPAARGSLSYAIASAYAGGILVEPFNLTIGKARGIDATDGSGMPEWAWDTQITINARPEVYG